VVPFLLENRLSERGARYRKGPDFAPYVLVDGTLVTGQNPASSTPPPRNSSGYSGPPRPERRYGCSIAEESKPHGIDLGVRTGRNCRIPALLLLIRVRTSSQEPPYNRA
jgi:hypothetical protein